MIHTWDTAKTIPQFLELRAAETPLALAFEDEVTAGRWEPITWQDFAARVTELRRGLQAAGLRKGDRLAIIAPVSLEWELLHHASLALGAVVVGFDAHDLPARIASMVEQADIAAYATADVSVLSQLGADRQGSARFVLQLGSNSGETPHGARRLTWTELKGLGAVKSDAPGPSPDDTATIIFTSGTTGAPKGIAYSHEQVCLAINAICDAFPFAGPGSRLLCWLPLSNLFQRVVNLAGMRKGAVTYLLPDPRRIMQVTSTVSPDIFVGVPRFYEKLYEGIRETIAAQSPLRRWLVDWAWNIGRRVSRRRLAGRRVPRWLALVHSAAGHVVLRRVRGIMGDRLRCMVTGSAATSRHLLEEFHAVGWLVLEAYGLSENVLPMAMNHIGTFRFGSVGQPLPGNEILVAEDGGIKVRGPGVFGGYLGQVDQSVLDSEGYYLTGDVGEFDSDGYLRLTGRASDMIKTSTGHRVAPTDIEQDLTTVPGIDQTLLIGNGRKCIAALCTCSQASLDDDEWKRIRQMLSMHVTRLNPHERPRGIVLLQRPFDVGNDELTPNLKLRRAVIESNYSELIQNLYIGIEQYDHLASGELMVIMEHDLLRLK